MITFLNKIKKVLVQFYEIFKVWALTIDFGRQRNKKHSSDNLNKFAIFNLL
jgi:hypothetical protein